MSGMTPMPSGSIRIRSSNPPVRSVGLTMPTVPRQLENAIEFSFPRCGLFGAGTGKQIT